MQPYFFPYIGYFQLMNAVDEFVVYDNIEFSKKGWVHRNRILVNGESAYITIPLKKDSDYLDIRDRYLADVWIQERKKMLNRINESYRKSPCFDLVFPVVEKTILSEELNLFRFLLNSLTTIKDHLGISTKLTVSSDIPIDHDLRAEKRVIATCRERKARMYINPIGGVGLYNKEEFKNNGLELIYLKTSDLSYSQFKNEFVPSLSIIDLMMFNSKERIKEYLESYFSFL